MNEISNNRRILGVIVIFVLFGCSVVLVEYAGDKVLNGSRGFIYGEGQWTKAQKRASIFLLSYVSTQDEEHYDNFQNQLEIHEGDQIARLTLLSENPDKELAYNGFLQGQNPPQDIDDMIWLLTHFNSLPAISEAVDYWIQGDEKIEQLRNLGEEIYHKIETGTLSDTDSREYLRKIIVLDEDLAQLENNFSIAMSKAARLASRTVFWTTIIISLGFIIVAAVVCVLFMRTLKSSNEQLKASEEKFRAVLDNSRDVIYQYQKEANGYDYMSKGVEEMLGYPLEEIKQGGPGFILERIHQEDKKRMEKELQKFTNSEQKGKYLDDTEFRVKKADGSYIWINNKRTPVLDNNGSATTIVGNVRDVSERKARMNKIDASLKQNQMLLSEVHHRVKNNLAIVSSLIELKK